MLGSIMRQVRYNSSHIYSKAPEASAKRAMDLEIMENDFANGDRIDMHSEDYLKELIKRASNGKFSVNGGSQGIEFFIVRGGGEGFLDPWYRDKDANRDIRFDEINHRRRSGIDIYLRLQRSDRRLRQ